MIQQYLAYFFALFPQLGAFVYAHPAVALFGAFVVLALVDLGEGGLLARAGKEFDRAKFSLQTKLLDATVIGAAVALFGAYQTSGYTSSAFSLSVVALLTPRALVLLADVRDKAAKLSGLPLNVDPPVVDPPTVA